MTDDFGLYDFRKAAFAVCGIVGTIIALVFAIYCGHACNPTLFGLDDPKSNKNLTILRILAYVLQLILIVSVL